ncbi:MAG TPA: flagellar biosynthetic protein FliO [Solirubrobacteraceae bacterium]|jgi:flagellar protein FliO/FliZ|nr:flagellar biosynthetic protein FliO [Solirubrobacteraceae bacterium]
MRSITLTRGVALGGALTLLCAQAAQAAATPAAENTPIHLGAGGTAHAAASGGSSSILRTIIALVVVIAIIYGIARILRAFKGRDAVRASGSGLAQIATLPLGPNRSVALVRAGRDIVLVGVAEQGVTALKTYTEAEAIANGIEIPEQAPADFDVAERPLDRLLEGLRRLTVRS